MYTFLHLVHIILPVFLVLATGYTMVRVKFFSPVAIDALMIFAQRFALPCLLFSAIAKIEFSQDFDWHLLLAYYTGGTVCFIAGILGAYCVLKRTLQQSVAIGFAALFGNSLLLGLPIMERTYGAAALSANYVILSVHASFCYFLGISTMEIVRGLTATTLDHTPTNRKSSAIFYHVHAPMMRVLNSMFRNPLIIGIVLGFFCALTGTRVPKVAMQSIDLIAGTSLPVALFALGGVFTRYRLTGDKRSVVLICLLSLIVYPGIVFILGHWLSLPTGSLRSAVVTASMSPGVNAFLFANLYRTAEQTAAGSVLMGTLLSIGTIPIWLTMLP